MGVFQYYECIRIYKSSESAFSGTFCLLFLLQVLGTFEALNARFSKADQTVLDTGEMFPDTEIKQENYRDTSLPGKALLGLYLLVNSSQIFWHTKPF